MTAGWGRAEGYSLAELLVATAVLMTVTGAAGVLATSVQRTAMAADAEHAARMDARHTLASVTRALEAAGSYAYGRPASVCGAGGDAAPLVLDPRGDGRRDAVRVRADINPPNGVLGGRGGRCDEAGEDVLIALDREAGTVTRRDGASSAGPVAISEGRVTGLRFEYRTADGSAASRAEDVVAVTVTLTVRVDGSPDTRPRVYTATTRLRED